MNIEETPPPAEDAQQIAPDPAELAAAEPLPASPAISLDPFEFFSGHISRIGGLGGNTPGPFESYAFHTPYVVLDEGYVVFVATFDGLVASRGTLDISVHAVSPRAGAVAHAVEVQRVPLHMLANETKGRASIQFEALSGVHYSLFGQIFDDTDARATSLSVALWRRADLDAEQELALAGRRTEFAATDVKPVARIISGDRPSLASPVSQMCTRRQVAEPVYREWQALLGLAERADVAAWGLAYIMQALRRYGVLQAKARGLGFGVGDGPLPAAMAAAGCTIMATDPGESGLDALRRPALIDDSLFDARVTFRTVTAGALCDDLADFDFIWSLGMEDRIGSPAAMIAAIDAAMGYLKPGGVAVHLVSYDPMARGSTGQAAGPFRRQDMERLALALISRGHEIAQFKYEAADALPIPGGAATTVFGIIARRGMMIG